MLRQIEIPLSREFVPKEDITAYELACLLPYFNVNGKPLYKSDLEKLGTAARHLENWPK